VLLRKKSLRESMCGLGCVQSKPMSFGGILARWSETKVYLEIKKRRNNQELTSLLWCISYTACYMVFNVEVRE
jgi:hypothetical protein